MVRYTFHHLLFTALFSFGSRRLNSLSESLKVIFSCWSFAIFIHPYTFYCSSFMLNTSIQFLFIAIIIHILALAIIRMSDYNYTDMIYRKDLGVMEYMSCPEAAKKWGFLNGVYRYYAERTASPVFQNLGICG